MNNNVINKTSIILKTIYIVYVHYGVLRTLRVITYHWSVVIGLWESRTCTAIKPFVTAPIYLAWYLVAVRKCKQYISCL